MGRSSFFDPLYDYVTFEEAEAESRRDFFLIPGHIGGDSEVKKILPFLSTLEFNRQLFLRQNNLAFFVYPSSTHTRFAHAIGCCYLGFLAANFTTIIDNNNERLSLDDWLKSMGLKEEFLLALLLHDIGHFAFSHALETNHYLWDVLKNKIENKVNLKHEDVASQFLLGSGSFAEAFKEKTKDVIGINYIADLMKSFEGIDPHAISFLIRGDEEDITRYDDDRKIALKMLHEMTSGVLDLDRIDHYRRDGYFSGLKFASNLNFSLLLKGITIHLKSDCYEIRLSDEAIGHALTLLHSKERLVHDCFENPINLAFEVMLHNAFNLFVFDDNHCERNAVKINPHPDDIRKIISLLLCTDEELLIELQSGNYEARNIIHRIRNRVPFSCIGRKIWKKGKITEYEIRKGIAEIAGIDQKHITIRLALGFSRDESKRPKEWLHLSSLFDENGCKLDQHEEFSKQIRYFQELQEQPGKVFWVFTDLDDIDIHDRLKKACGEITNS